MVNMTLFLTTTIIKPHMVIMVQNRTLNLKLMVPVDTRFTNLTTSMVQIDLVPMNILSLRMAKLGMDKAVMLQVYICLQITLFITELGNTMVYIKDTPDTQLVTEPSMYLAMEAIMDTPRFTSKGQDTNIIIENKQISQRYVKIC
ncbi:unnamed protein product [Larinioides sclopetarius]|uniref:Uncharacterized protein n=1 Tax=Larinioides sclopetarius TaxID=280406 RepID=A0AAV2BMY4_9ARAC